ncbi:chorismate--pyruvate lyase family protein [Thalassotalea marina]|uniref:Probable chorismate pyruvate-lyase n=1 Tax=Thalassotalea marina TaxID=1673741 RepID=A0A919BNS1_9GAMM|nr:chorismate lyase [Thalassotalea marina]GHF99801.1 putative chorismate pyruvate-lyase [Thalassotalea marina]
MVDKQHKLFPVGMQANWCSEGALALAPQLKDWLLDPGSLTARLSNLSKSFRVQVLGQSVQHCTIEESNQDIPPGEPVLVREVLLLCNDVPQVFARSLLPLASLTGEQQQLATLGSQSLGQVLFNHANLKRKRIEVASFDSQSSVTQLAKELKLSIEHNLWGRRSVFIIDDKPLMVAEVFLPDSFAYQNIMVNA